MPPLHPCGLRAFVAPPKKPTCSKSALARGGCGAGAKGGVLQLQEAPAAGALTRASCRYQPCINSTAPPCIAHGEAARPPLRPPHLAPHCPTAPMPSLLCTFKSIPSPLCVRSHAHIGKPHPPWSRFLLLFFFLHRNRAAAGRVGGKKGGAWAQGRALRRGAARCLQTRFTFISPQAAAQAGYASQRPSATRTRSWEGFRRAPREECKSPLCVSGCQKASPGASFFGGARECPRTECLARARFFLMSPIEWRWFVA